MKALTYTLSMVVMISASTSSAFCMKKYSFSSGGMFSTALVKGNAAINNATNLNYKNVTSADTQTVNRRK